MLVVTSLLTSTVYRQLEEVEVKQRGIEERGVAIERALRGDGPGTDTRHLTQTSLLHVPTCTTAVCDCSCCVVSVDAAKNESELMQEWFNMVHEKNVLVRYESELMIQ